MPPLFDVGDIARRFGGSYAAGEMGGGIIDQITAYGNPEPALWRQQVQQVWEDPNTQSLVSQFQFDMTNNDEKGAQKALFELTTNMLQRGLPPATVNDLVQPFTYQLTLLNDAAKQRIKAQEFLITQGKLELDPSAIGGGGAPLPAPPPGQGSGGGMAMPAPPMGQDAGGDLLRAIPGGQAGAPVSSTDLPMPAMPMQSSAFSAPPQRQQHSSFGTYGGIPLRMPKQGRLGDLPGFEKTPPILAEHEMPVSKLAELFIEYNVPLTPAQKQSAQLREQGFKLQEQGLALEAQRLAMQVRKLDEATRGEATPYTLGDLAPDAPPELATLPLTQKQAVKFGIDKLQPKGETPSLSYRKEQDELKREAKKYGDAVTALNAEEKYMRKVLDDLTEQQGFFDRYDEKGGKREAALSFNPGDPQSVIDLKNNHPDLFQAVQPLLKRYWAADEVVNRLWQSNNPAITGSYAPPNSAIYRKRKKKKKEEEPQAARSSRRSNISPRIKWPPE